MALSPKKLNYQNLAGHIIENLSKHQIEGYYAQDRDEALEIACRFLSPGSTVSWGGSATLNEIGFIDAVNDSDCIVLDRSQISPEDMDEFYGRVAVCDYYYMSTNAITIDGQLVNIDGNGNRVASLIHGPKNVIVIAGMNKVASDIPSAFKHVRDIAAPANTVRLNKKTPCANVGHCCDCYSPGCICSQFVITRRSNTPNRIKVILVGEELGF